MSREVVEMVVYGACLLLALWTLARWLVLLYRSHSPRPRAAWPLTLACLGAVTVMAIVFTRSATLYLWPDQSAWISANVTRPSGTIAAVAMTLGNLWLMEVTK